jgi:general secretion pathway protein A
LDYNGNNPVALYEKFSQFLSAQYEQRQRTVLIVDEAQNLGPDVLDELRMLSNLNATDEQFLQVILVGQPELRKILSRPDLMQFSQRVAADYHIAPLTLKETIAYIRYRLISAGGTQEVFAPHAYVVIHAASRGVPRLINILCDTVLSYAFGDEIQIIDEEYIKEVLKERSEGGLLALGQNPLRQLGDKAYEAPNLDELFAKVSQELKQRSTN